jgi:hypothetical protein
MKIDRSLHFRLFLADPDTTSGFLPADELEPLLRAPLNEAARCANPSRFAAAELASALGRVLVSPVQAGRGDEGEGCGILILDAGMGDAAENAEPNGDFAWRASPERVELHGASPVGLLAAVYDFLGSAGFSWVSPGPKGERVPAELELARASSRRKAAPDGVPIGATMILGHGSYLERAEDYLLFAARNGYRGVFFHTTPEAIAFGAAPIARYDALRPRLLPLIASLGLEIQLGGHGLSSLLPRRLFRREPDLFRMAGGERSKDRNFCASNPRSLEIVADNFTAFVRAHPEVSVFHFWPDDLPGGGWCSCPACSSLSPADQSLAAARALAKVLERERPGARLSFLAYHDTEDSLEGKVAKVGVAKVGTKSEATEADPLPPNLELLWAPRKRSWASGYGDPKSALNSISRGRYEAAARAFATNSHVAAGSREIARRGPAIFEYWEDAILFKASVPPLSRTMSADLAYYAGLGPTERPSSIGILLTGPGLPLAPRPNLWLFPRLLAVACGGDVATGGAAARGGRGGDASSELPMETVRAEALKAWIRSAYGPAAEAMGAYWEALEAAWMIDLDLESGDTDIFMPEPMTKAPFQNPADWGDPRKASPERLSAKRARSEELFGRLREAEAALSRAEEKTASAPGQAASKFAVAVKDEAASYALASAILELDSARVSAYDEAAHGSDEAAADIALIARSILGGLYRAARAMPDRRGRRNLRFLMFLDYDLRLRSMARYKSSPIRRGLGVAKDFLELAFRALGMLRLWE